MILKIVLSLFLSILSTEPSLAQSGGNGGQPPSFGGGGWPSGGWTIGWGGLGFYEPPETDVVLVESECYVWDEGGFLTPMVPKYRGNDCCGDGGAAYSITRPSSYFEYSCD